MRPFLTLLLISFLLLPSCDTPVTNVNSCGDGFLDPGEECEAGLAITVTCRDLGFYQQVGALTCMEDCKISTVACTGRCGDTVIQQNEGERCDGQNLGAASCLSLGLGEGTLACAPDCTYDSSGCEIHFDCGDGEVTPPAEECDGEAFAGVTCESLGYYGGALVCTDDCTRDESDCEAAGRCGDSVVQTAMGEECEGNDPGEETCQDYQFYQGNLLCTNCRIDTSACNTFCGDEVVQAFYREVCDGTAFAGATCATLGWYGGSLACSDDCLTLDVSGCQPFGRCGDGVIQSSAGELCDGDNFNGATCATYGFTPEGLLTCASDCTSISTAGCMGCITDYYCGPSCVDCTVQGKICKTDHTGCTGCNLTEDCTNPAEQFCHTATGTCVPTCEHYATVFTMTGGGTGCTGGGGIPVGLSGSEIGRNYQLYLDGAAVGAPIPGTGAALSFGARSAPGRYTVAVPYSLAGCLVPMAGTADVVLDSPPSLVAASASLARTCGGQSVTFDVVGPIGGSCSGTWQFEWRDAPAGGGVLVRTWDANAEYSQVISTTTTLYLRVRCSTCPTDLSPASGPVTVTVPNCVGNCSVCSDGACVANQGACLGNCDECTGGDDSFSCVGKLSLCDGNCVQCMGGGTNYSCTANEPACQGTCSTCTGSDATTFNCAANTAECLGNCDVCAAGGDAFTFDCAANQSACTGNCDVCAGGGNAFNCAADGSVCGGNCGACNGSGTEFNCAANQGACQGNCDVCNGGPLVFQCEGSESLCTGNCDSCTGSGTNFSCVALPGACGGNCSNCTGAGTNWSCVANAAACTGNCDVCSGSGTTFSCAADANLCTGNCDTCSGSGNSFSCAASDALCTGNCDACTGSGTAFNCSAVSGVCGGNCSACSGSGNSFSCAANAALCTGNCDTCSGSGLTFNCAANAAACTGNCNAGCSGSGTAFNCVKNEAACTGNCDVCSGTTTLNCAASASLCTGNCDVCSGSGTAFSCAADATKCTGNCDVCNGSGTAFNCAASASLCTGNCDVCNGSGTAYSCAANSSVCGTCQSCSGSGTSYSCVSYGDCSPPGAVTYTGCSGGQCKVCQSNCRWGFCATQTACGVKKNPAIWWLPVELHEYGIWPQLDRISGLSVFQDDEETYEWELFQ